MMGLAAASAGLNIGVRFAKVTTDFDELPQAAQRLWIHLWDITRFGEKPVHDTDREIAAACGRGMRWVQKALSQLLGLATDGEPTPMIDKEKKYGPRDVAGRWIRIAVPFLKPRAKGKVAPPLAAPQADGPSAAPIPAPPEEPPGEPMPEGVSFKEYLAQARAAAAASAPAAPASGKLDDAARAIAAELARKARARARLAAQVARLELMADAGERAAQAELATARKALADLDLDAGGDGAHPRE